LIKAAEDLECRGMTMGRQLGALRLDKLSEQRGDARPTSQLESSIFLEATASDRNIVFGSGVLFGSTVTCYLFRRVDIEAKSE